LLPPPALERRELHIDQGGVVSVIDAPAP